MIPSTLIEATELAARRNLLVLDCRFELSDPASGARAYAQGHIPGAMYANLDRDLSDLSKSASFGRHPLPDDAAFSAVLGRWGWTPDTPVVAYDAANGALAAARAWWMLRLVGTRECAVLDGGIQAWMAAGLPTDTAAPKRTPTSVSVTYDVAQILYTDDLVAALHDPDVRLLDARGAARFRGEGETIDKVAGHIPGALNRPFADNLAADGRFKPASQLRAEFAALLGDVRPDHAIHSCGSGVTACHNLLAMEHAGLSGSRVYAPSWSGWIADPTHPVAANP